jgi:CDP-diacylglycerol--serine O-phosphatidyltransferase
MKKHIPNAITCLNLFCGCIGIVLAFSDNLLYSCYAIFFAAVFDFLDGLAARLLKAYSDLGKELDSLADVVSFGVLPSVIVYQLFLISPTVGDISPYLNFSAFLISIGSALRLAKFNLDTRQAINFIGLPTPANALLIASLPLTLTDSGTSFSNYILNAYFLTFFSGASAFLLLIELPLISLKFNDLTIGANIYRYILIFSGLLLLLILKFAAIPFIIVLYILLSIIQFRKPK